MKLIKQLLIWGLIIALSLGTSSSLARAESNSLSRSEVDSIPSFLDQAMREFMVEEHIPNAVVTIVHNGDILFSQGYGLADIEQQKPVDPSHSLFRIGSTAKVFTWIAVMQLVEEGKLDLDTDIREYIDFYIPSTIHGSNETASPITLAHLMTHTPGFEDYPDQIFRLSPTEMPELDRYVREHLPARIFPPGEVAAYSNYGTALAGYIVERVSGLSFEEYIEKHIFTPLEMNHSTFRQPVPEHLTEQLVQGYRYVENEFKKGEFEYTPVPAGGMSTTATDMALFMLAYLQPEQAEEKRVLKQDTLRSMHLQQFTHHPYLGGMAYGFKESSFNGYRTLFHGGGTMLFDTGLYFLPEHQFGFFISYSGANHLVHTTLFQALMDRYFPADESWKHGSDADGLTVSTESIERSKALAGEYHANRKSLTTAEKFLSLIMGVIQVNIDNEGYLLVTHVGETNRFVEIEPGIYRNLRETRTQDYYGAFRTLVFQTDPFGHIMLIPDGPMTYSKAPWYATSLFTIATLLVSIAFIMGTFLFWCIRLAIRLVKRREKTSIKAWQISKGLALVFSLMLLLLLLGFIANGETDPVYQLPNDAYIPIETPFLDALPYALALLSIPILMMALFLWWKKSGGITARLHYALYTCSVLTLIVLFYYWNVFTLTFGLTVYVFF